MGKYMNRTDLLQLVMDVMKWDKQKAQLWFNTRNPLLGGVTPNSFEMFSGKNKLEKFIRSQLSENKPEDAVPPDRMEKKIPGKSDGLRDSTKRVFEGGIMKCSFDDNEAEDSFEVECGNNAEYCITLNLCRTHLRESDDLGHAFEEKYGKEIEKILNERFY
jgi:hypothetical protein